MTANIYEKDNCAAPLVLRYFKAVIKTKDNKEVTDDSISGILTKETPVAH